MTTSRSAIFLSDLAKQLAEARAERDELARQLDRTARRPWRPIKHYLNYIALKCLSALTSLVSKRSSERFARSAEKRCPWRFARPNAGADINRAAVDDGRVRDRDSGGPIGADTASAPGATAASRLPLDVEEPRHSEFPVAVRAPLNVRLTAAWRHPLHRDKRRSYRTNIARAKQSLPIAIEAAEAQAPRQLLPSEEHSPGVFRQFHVIPHYINPVDTWSTAPSVCNSRIAIHFHLFYFDLLDDFIVRFQSIPFSFDLFVSIPDFAPESQSARVEESLRAALQPRLQKIAVRQVPNRGRDIAPFIIEFGKTLLDYDVVGHFHTKKSPHNPQLEGWRDTIIDLLLGPRGCPGGHIARIVGIIETNAKIVYAEGSPYIPREPTGWAGNHDIARDILDGRFGLSIDDFPVVEFAEGSMFWARTAALREFLELPLSYEDFPAEPIPADGTLAHALERLVLILAQDEEGDCVRLHKSDSVPDYRYFEEAQDFSSRLRHPDVKVLAYYLPQFHSIPENDEWHGVGFTEWTKVRAANPLFHGHFQQHIPHNEIGYYLIEDDSVLRRQASDMKRAGVYGNIFYHYWFNGKLILNNPVNILLRNPDIDMPFCFCWANENWTRRWDGSEHEILLKQDYSEVDAQSFIRYLVPFFRDARYIRIGGRPVLFIYRATLIPIMSTYLDVWRRECEAAGIEEPYVIVTLAAGAHDPRDFGADAGAERVLYDWTDGKVPEMTSEVDAYAPLRGRVFSYDRIKEYYASQPIETAFTCFRSLVPNWDNTARYGAGAHLLHGSTPAKFQEWLEVLVAQTKQALPPDRRFILVNAWNEWAEGAHLEADSRYGYAYLNAIGRALSNEPLCTPALDSRQALYIAQAAEGAREFGAIMMIVHRWGGGTERNVDDLVEALARKNITVFFTRMDVARPNWVVVEAASADTELALGAFDIAASPEGYARLMRRLHVRHVHVHHLAGFPETASEWLQRAWTSAETSYDISIHDYMMICPRVFMVGETGAYCGEPPLSRCETCIATLGSVFGTPSVDEWRARFGRLLAGARRRFVPNEDVSERFSRYFPRLEFTVRPHPEPRRNVARLKSLQATHAREESANSTGAVRHVAIVGHLAQHKGFDLILRCAQFAELKGAPIRFTIVGATDRDAAFDALPNVTILGRYEASEFLDIIERESPDLAFLSSVCPETYSFTLSESATAGVYPVAFDLGAIASRIRALGWGKLFPVAWLNDPEAVLKALLEVEPTPPPSSVFRLAQGAGYSDILADYYGLKWRVTAPEEPHADAPPRPVTHAALRELRFEAPKGEAALFVTHSPNGRLKPHVQQYISALNRTGIGVFLIVAADMPSLFEPAAELQDVSGLFVRNNEGYDFAAWAHVIRQHPEFRDIDFLYLVNDSVIGPLDQKDFSTAIRRVREGHADVYGMTENFEKRWHLQSYFLAIKQPALRSLAFGDFINSIVSLTNKEAVIDRFELSFATTLAKAGFRAEALFTVPSGQNQTLYHWSELVNQGFPFVKIQAARDHIIGVDREAVREFLKSREYFWDGANFIRDDGRTGEHADVNGDRRDDPTGPL